MGPGTHLPDPNVVVPGKGWNVDLLPGRGVRIPGIPPPPPPPDGNSNFDGLLTGITGSTPAPPIGSGTS